MKNILATTIKIATIAAIILGIQWYVEGGLVNPELALVVVVISISIAYLFYQAFSYERVRKNLTVTSIFRRLDIKEFSRIFGAIALLPTASIILSRYTLNSAVRPLRLYILFVLLFLAGWAMGTVETTELFKDKEERL
ncbi:MAG TPA: hypothetical protein VE439_08600 [Anaerolineae bacterium]|jgi:hypothetical protein|nr:hypothetical protein [Anaerolineae bacterium]